MALIKIKQVQTGQILQADAIGPKGRVLLTKDTTLNEKHIEILNTWGVVQVDVQGDDVIEDKITVFFNDLPLEVKNKIKSEINDRFIHCDKEHPLINELVMALRNKLAQEYSTEKMA